MSIKIKVQMTEKAMYHFLLHNYYSKFSGIFGTALGIFVFALAVLSGVEGNYSTTVLFGFLTVILLFMEPFSLKSAAKRQIKNSEMFQKPLIYTFSEEGLSVEQDEEKAMNNWDNFMKIVATKQIMILYVTRVRAIIIPKEDLKDDYQAVVEIIKKNVPKKVKVKL